MCPLPKTGNLRSSVPYPYLQGIKLAESSEESEDMEIDLSVGGDHVWKFLLNEVIRGENDLEGPVATNTRVGWVLNGLVQIESKETLSSVNFVATTHVLKVGNTPLRNCQTADKFSVEETVQCLWDIESQGIRIDTESVHDSFIKNISFENGRYTVQLPFRKHHKPLPDNYELSLVGLNSLYKRLQREPPLLNDYNEIIKEQINDGTVERVNETDVPEPGEVYFIPHQVVIRKHTASTHLRLMTT